MARGHDGLFRGAPEPVVLIATYAVANEKSALLGRDLVAFSSKSRCPSFAKGELSRSYSVANAGHFVVLVVALEEDSGEDIQRVYGALESTTSSHVWSHEHANPSPSSLALLADDGSWTMPQRCELEDDTGPFSSSCHRDKWVGVSAWVTDVTHPRVDLRFHVRSEDRKNDWTVLLSVIHE